MKSTLSPLVSRMQKEKSGWRRGGLGQPADLYLEVVSNQQLVLKYTTDCDYMTSSPWS